MGDDGAEAICLSAQATTISAGGNHISSTDQTNTIKENGSSLYANGTPRRKKPGRLFTSQSNGNMLSSMLPKHQPLLLHNYSSNTECVSPTRNFSARNLLNVRRDCYDIADDDDDFKSADTSTKNGDAWNRKSQVTLYKAGGGACPSVYAAPG